MLDTALSGYLGHQPQGYTPEGKHSLIFIIPLRFLAYITKYFGIKTVWVESPTASSVSSKPFDMKLRSLFVTKGYYYIQSLQT